MARTSEHAVAIVTGAGSGVGRAIAQRLAALEFSLLLVGRREDALHATGASLPGAWVAIAADVREVSACAHIIEAARERYGRLDVLVNNAGAYTGGSIGDHDAGGIERMFATNSIGPAMLIREAWPVFEAQRSGAVVNVSSLAARAKHARPMAYAASKAALDSMTHAVALEGAAIGVRAWSIQPGFVETAMLRSFADESRVPRDEAAAPEMVAEVVAACLAGAHPSGAEVLVREASAAGRITVRAIRERLRRAAIERL